MQISAPPQTYGTGNSRDETRTISALTSPVDDSDAHWGCTTTVLEKGMRLSLPIGTKGPSSGERCPAISGKEGFYPESTYSCGSHPCCILKPLGKLKTTDV